MREIISIPAQIPMRFHPEWSAAESKDLQLLKTFWGIHDLKIVGDFRVDELAKLELNQIPQKSYRRTSSE
jgi:hypothetical protein